jgi:hypothetical protein
MNVNCGKYICNEDLISFDDLEDGDCVGIKDDFCVSCDTARQARDANPQEFFKNPGKILFDKVLTKNELTELWKDLEQNCTIKFIVLAKEEIVFVSPDVEIDYDKLKRDINAKYLPQLTAMINVIELSHEITLKVVQIETESQKEIYEKQLRNDMMRILQRGGWNCLLIHHPLEVPYIFALILKTLVDTPSKMNILTSYIDSNPVACVEAEFDNLYRKITVS